MNNLAGRPDHPLWMRPAARARRLDRWLERLRYTDHVHNPFGSHARHERCVPSAMEELTTNKFTLGPSRHVWQPSKITHQRRWNAADQVFCWLHNGRPDPPFLHFPTTYHSAKYVIRREDWERTRFYLPWPPAQ